MKKKVFISTAMAVIIAFTSYNVYVSKSENAQMEALTLENVEALADGENFLCPNGCMGSGSSCYCNGWYPTLKEYKR